MTKRPMRVDEIEKLKPGENPNRKGRTTKTLEPYAVATGSANLRVHVSPLGRKTFQLRRNGTMVTIGRYPGYDHGGGAADRRERASRLRSWR